MPILLVKGRINRGPDFIEGVTLLMHREGLQGLLLAQESPGAVPGDKAAQQALVLERYIMAVAIAEEFVQDLWYCLCRGIGLAHRAVKLVGVEDRPRLSSRDRKGTRQGALAMLAR